MICTKKLGFVGKCSDLFAKGRDQSDTHLLLEDVFQFAGAFACDKDMACEVLPQVVDAWRGGVGKAFEEAGTIKSVVW